MEKIKPAERYYLYKIIHNQPLAIQREEYFSYSRSNPNGKILLIQVLPQPLHGWRSLLGKQSLHLAQAHRHAPTMLLQNTILVAQFLCMLTNIHSMTRK